MNKIQLVGNLAGDPELRQTSQGISVCTFRVALNRRIANANGEREADFIPVVAWRGLGENCAKYLTKGRKVAVSGTLQTRNYEDKQGNKRTAFEVVADDVEFLTPRGEGGAAAPTGAPRYQAPAANNGLDDVSGFTEMDDSALPF